MTECDPPKIRSLIEKHLGKDKLKEYDIIVEQCKLGQALKDDRVWAPLCHEYPNLKGVTCEEIEDFLSITKPEDDNDKRIVYRPPEERKFAKEYIKHVRVYDRDEAYEAFKNIGDWIEVDNPGILKDPSTIFVTTPTGGHEMLSIFAYANDISKKQIPSDIRFQHITTGAPVSDQSYKQNPISSAKYIEKIGYKEDEKIPTDIYGQTWLYDRSMPVKNVFIIDDIIASGEQIHRTTMSLEEMFPGANINSVTLCKRSDDVVSPALPYKIKKYYTDTETIGINSFKDRRLGGVVGKEYITCSFSHCCPDGESDKLMVELMGSERCSPNKRISRRDL